MTAVHVVMPHCYFPEKIAGYAAEHQFCKLADNAENYKELTSCTTAGSRAACNSATWLQIHLRKANRLFIRNLASKLRAQNQQPNLIPEAITSPITHSFPQVHRLFFWAQELEKKTFSNICMFRLALNRSLRPIVDRGKPCLSALLSLDLILHGRQNVDLRSGHAIGEIQCSARFCDGPSLSHDMASLDQPEDSSTLWARDEIFVSKNEAEQFVNGVITYLRSNGGRGGGGLVNRLYKCLQQVTLLPFPLDRLPKG